MGHLRLGRLPKTRRWREVVELLDAPEANSAAISAAVLHAAERRLRGLGKDSSLSYAFWLLTKITWAARQPGFEVELRRLGFEVTDDTSIFSFISEVSGHLRRTLPPETPSGPFSELVSLAVRRALTDSIGGYGRSLFGSSVDDLRDALRTQSRQAQFGLLAQRFFGDLLARTLAYFLDRESASTLTARPDASAVAANEELMSGIDLHARQSARIVRDYAGGWYSKYNWQTKGQITQDDTRRFVAYALRKLRSEVQREIA